MCVAVVTYMENSPHHEEAYKTSRYAVELKENVPQGANVNEAISRLFMVAKNNVQAQIQQAKGDAAFSHQPAPSQQQTQPSQNGTKPASEKQVKYIKTLARKKGYGNDAINSLPYDYFQKSYYQLTSREASTIIEKLNQKR